MLTEGQIQHLHKFCTKHYVRYYDLQVELVDHLAIAVEEKMANNSGLSFEQALDDVYKGFGISGFSKLVAAREHAAGKRNNKEYFHLFGSFFTPPRIAFTILLYFALWLPFYIAGNNSNAATGILLGYAFIFVAATTVHLRFFKKQHPAPVKSLLTVDHVWSLDNSITVIFATQVIFFFDTLYGYRVLNSTPHIFIFITFYVVMIIGYMASARAYHKTYENARNNYPLAFEN